MREISLVLFDLGGTLIYFDGDQADTITESDRAMQSWLQDAGFHLPPDFADRFTAQVRGFLAGGDPDFVEITSANFLRVLLAGAGYPSPPDETIRAALRVKFAITEERWKLEEDTLVTLDQLQAQGLRLALVTNAGDAHDVDALIDRRFLRPYFKQVIISAQVGVRKPNPKIFQMALDFFNASPANAVMVGDTLGADILGARNAGIASVWITRRAYRSDNRAHEDTIQPDAVITRLSELPPLLARGL